MLRSYVDPRGQDEDPRTVAAIGGMLFVRVFLFNVDNWKERDRERDKKIKYRTLHAI